jgi:hypothetical protein
MHHSGTPLEDTATRRTRAVRFVFMVSGTVTVLLAATLARPARIEAQGIGTMQVVAVVTPAGAAWDGLAAAQQTASVLAFAPGAGRPRRIAETSLAQIEVQPAAPASGPRPQLAISIQYLRN